MQVGDLPLVFELSGVHTPPKGGGERLIRSQSSDSSGMSSRPNASGESASSSGISSRPNARASGESLGGASPMSNGRRHSRTLGTRRFPMRPIRKSDTRTRCPLWDFTLHAVGRARWDSSKRRIQRTVENYHENRCNNTGNYHHRETYTHPFLSGDWIGSTLTN